ncbi:diol dehydratase reactivase alpha subunit [Caldanaerobius fijiensis DSM 17918]|uniref:Diol dehydratase reactivase alpha subunit n=1 Tax=Caldanaerobius fijiensis DSM 17918 TaxID=1121256 RepID=A0A1M4UF64_9THEO|nr:diol dehydratase reactivase subunit alpha [Caldanaerobius fijiensis]SHE55365.1 diol dehydratase reactivase alpha subunit [Caldanaerobius fijiensis DSM 17918]
MIVAGIDVGNSTTEVTLAEGNKNTIRFLSSGISDTTGLKGTQDNIVGILNALQDATKKSGISIKDIDLCGINKVSPVIGDIAVQNVTETIITESSMIGHNPDTPGGCGIGVGVIVDINLLENISKSQPVIVLVPSDWSFQKAAAELQKALKNGINVVGAIVQNNDGVLISNRINKTIPIIDEVKNIEKIPKGSIAAIEVAPPGQYIRELSNPYGIATLLKLSPKETKKVIPIAKSLIGKRSGVVIMAPEGEVKEKVVPAGSITLIGKNNEITVDVSEGADAIMDALSMVGDLLNVTAEKETNIGSMLHHIRSTMAAVSGLPTNEIMISDLYAVDTIVPLKVKGGLANEIFMESGVGIAAMVKSNSAFLGALITEIEKNIAPCCILGDETLMALLGAFTTPGTDIPLAILDVGGGSIDAAYIDHNYEVRRVNMAGAGNMVSLLINEELSLHNIEVAEELKKYPLGKSESLFHIRNEDGSISFFKNPLRPELFARVLLNKNGDYIPILIEHTMDKIRSIRREVKYNVLVRNSIRALKKVAPNNDLRKLEYIVMIGGSSLDFEYPHMLMEELTKCGVVVGQGNIRGKEGPRNAVATGLAIALLKEIQDGKIEL